MSDARYDKSREISQRIVVTANLIAKTPIHLGGDSPTSPVDMTLLKDPILGTPLLTGATLAGALRAYLTEQGDDAKNAAKWLFGGEKEDADGDQSPLIVDDAVAKKSSTIALRDGVRIEPTTRTAADKALYNMEVWDAGTTFPLRFELLLGTHPDEKKRTDAQARTEYHTTLKRALRTCLKALEEGDIGLGLRKSRGYGEVTLVSVPRPVFIYNLTTPDGLMRWLRDDTAQGEPLTILGEPLPPKGSSVKLTAEFALESPLLIRSYSGGLNDPDAIHLHGKTYGSDDSRPLVSGTAIAGALRARARKIVCTLNRELRDPTKRTQTGAPADDAENLISSLFGDPKKREGRRYEEGSRASRIRVKERLVKDAAADRVQNRIKIDRFTGGVMETALFNEQPVAPKDDGSTTITIELTVRPAEPRDIGLVLLLLRDLWTEDLPIGGTSSVGRGRLKGRVATLCCDANFIRFEDASDETHPWKIKIEKTPGWDVEACVKAFVEWVQKTGGA